MASTTTLAPSTVECPQCGKHSIVPTADGIYKCLNCDFHRDLNTSKSEGDADGGGVKSLIAILGTLAMLVLFV